MTNTELKYPEELNKKFIHNSWFHDRTKSKAYVLDYFAQTSDFVLKKRKNKVQTGHLLDPYQYEEVIAYTGREGGSYRISSIEKAFYLQRKEYWKEGKIGEIKHNLDKTEYYISVIRWGDYIGWAYDSEFKGADTLPFNYSRSEVLKLLKDKKITPLVASNALLPERSKWEFSKFISKSTDAMIEVKNKLGRTEYDSNLLLTGLYFFNFDRKSEKWIEHNNTTTNTTTMLNAQNYAQMTANLDVSLLTKDQQNFHNLVLPHIVQFEKDVKADKDNKVDVKLQAYYNFISVKLQGKEQSSDMGLKARALAIKRKRVEIELSML